MSHDDEDRLLLLADIQLKGIIVLNLSVQKYLLSLTDEKIAVQIEFRAQILLRLKQQKLLTRLSCLFRTHFDHFADLIRTIWHQKV